MSTAGQSVRWDLEPATERRRDALLLALSALLHIALLFLLPGLSAPIRDSVDLIVELAARQPVVQAAGMSDHGSGSSDADGTAAAASAEQSTPGPALDEPVEGATGPRSPDVQPEDAGGGEPSQQAASQPESAAGEPAAAANDATSVVPPPKPVVVQPVKEPEQPVKQPQPEPKPQVGEPQQKEQPKPKEQKASKSEEKKPTVPDPDEKSKPAVLPKVDVDKSGPPAKPKEEEPSPPAVPDVNVDENKPGKGQPEDPGTGGEQPGGQPSGDGQQGGGEAEDGDGSSGDEAGAPGPPPGPSGLELDLLKEYGDNARRRIRMLARTPERAREQNLSGKVKFEFEIAKTGKLVSVKVIDSSGQPILDEECLAATKVAAPFGRFPRKVTVEKWKFQMTLDFPLY